MKINTNRALRFSAIFFCLISFHSFSQVTPLTFSTHVVTLEACDNFPSQMGTIKVYNHTSGTITLNWEQTEVMFPTTGTTALIIDPIQFAPHVTNGSSYVDAFDSTDILFHIWPDEMNPGDTALFQINVYDPLDSLNTTAILTAIIYCPLNSGVVEGDNETALLIYPNPFISSATIDLPNELRDVELVVYTLQGVPVKRLKTSHNKTQIYRDGLPSGVYFIRLLQSDEMISCNTKLIVTDQ